MVAEAQDFSEETSMTGALKPRFLKADVLAQPLTSMGKFDIILSNPPYVMESEKALMRRNVLDHEPHLALFVPDDDPLKFYKAVAEVASQSLSDKGFGIVEINEALGPETEQVFRDAGFSKTMIVKDLSERDRFVCFSSLIG
jgi:release factor glutamine methyltransferase